jgi:ribonuclease R
VVTKSERRPRPGLPSRDAVVAYIREHGGRVGKREIARAFGLEAGDRHGLKEILKALEAEGLIGRAGKRRFGAPGMLPRIAVVEITGTDLDGEVLARPVTWDEPSPPPKIYVAPEKRGRSAVGPGERVLAHLEPIPSEAYEARIIRRLPAAPQRALGVFRVVDGEPRIKSIDRRVREDFLVVPGEDRGARPGELVWVEVRRGRALGPKFAKVVERLGDAEGPRAISLIAIHDHDIPCQFPPEALRAAETAGSVPLDGREDLRPLPLVTIDGADARDFDDAVFAEPDDDPGNPGGWHLVVAIADVAWYVQPGDALDREAFKRGNSVYFPDRVVPMLPEPLSNGWCSLKPDEDRPCLAAHLWIDRAGQLLRHRFVRGLMRSAARLTYTQVQDARDGRPDETTGPLQDRVVLPLYGAYASLAEARQSRGVLELDLPERRVVLADDGTVDRIETRQRFDSHRLIEEFMITANVAAATVLEERHVPCMFRIHDQPTKEKLESLRAFLETLHLRLARGQVIRAAQFNSVLAKVADTPVARLVNDVILRSQAQAEYHPDNIGHFGLALRRYCHFTSPIRRYADLLVHRSLIATLGLGSGGLSNEPGDFARIGEHISATERRAATAERDAVDRFTAAFMVGRVGASFSARISGVTRFGLFVALHDTGADGLVPVRSLPDDYYVHDEAHHRLVGRDSGLTFQLGGPVEVRLVDADPITGGLVFELLQGGTYGKRPSARRDTGRDRPRPTSAARSRRR